MPNGSLATEGAKTKLQWNTNRKSYVVYGIASLTLTDDENHFR